MQASRFRVVTTALLVLEHWLYQRLRPTEFKPSRVEMWSFGLIVLLYYAFITVPTAPKALWVLPTLMGLTFWALRNNQRSEMRSDAIAAFFERVNWLSYLLLFNIPLVACAIYFFALANDLRLPTNLIFYYSATPLGAILWITSVVVCGRRGRVQPSLMSEMVDH